MQSVLGVCSRYKYLVEYSGRQRDAAIAALQFVSTFLVVGLSIPNKEALLTQSDPKGFKLETGDCIV